jgi:hypothetical protein
LRDDVEKLDSCPLPIGRQNSATAIESSMQVPQIKHGGCSQWCSPVIPTTGGMETGGSWFEDSLDKVKQTNNKKK